MASSFVKTAAAAVFAVAAALAPAKAADGIVVASKIDTEGALLGNMIVQVLEHAGLPVENKLQLGPTKIVRTALTSGEVDIYPEYTGNAGFFFSVDSDPAWKKAETAYEKAKALDAANKIVWLTPAPANNTWAIAVRKDLADANKLATLDDFGKWVAGGGKVKLAGSAEFVESAGGAARLPGGLRLQAQRRPAPRPLRRRHRGDREGGGRADLGRQRGDGLRHRRPARRARPRRPHRHQGRAGGLRAGADGARGDPRRSIRRSRTCSSRCSSR